MTGKADVVLVKVGNIRIQVTELYRRAFSDPFVFPSGAPQVVTLL